MTMMTAASRPDLACAGEEELLPRAQDEHAWPAQAELVRHHFDDLGRRIAWRVRRGGLQWADAEDAMQNGFLTLCAKIDQFEGGRQGSPGVNPLRAFLRGVAARYARDFIRGKRRLRRRDEKAAAAKEAGDSDAAAAPDWWSPSAGWQGDPALAALRQEEVERVEEAVKHWNDEERRLWAMAKGGKSAEETAAMLGVTAWTVRRRLGRLVRRLRALLGPTD